MGSSRVVCLHTGRTQGHVHIPRSGAQTTMRDTPAPCWTVFLSLRGLRQRYRVYYQEGALCLRGACSLQEQITFPRCQRFAQPTGRCLYGTTFVLLTICTDRPGPCDAGILDTRQLLRSDDVTKINDNLSKGFPNGRRPFSGLKWSALDDLIFRRQRRCVAQVVMT